MTPLISPSELRSLLEGEPAPALLDVRWNLMGPPGRQEYDRAHLPGAVFVDLETELAAPAGPGGRHPLPEAEQLQRAFRDAAVDSERPVVVYDAGDGSVAARGWWLLRWAGHARVFVLDGGFAAWVEEGGATTTRVPHPEPGDFVVRPGGMPTADADAAARLARTGVLLDARAGERYRGEREPVDPRAGHIPGAVNAPAAEHVTADGRWRAPKELADRFAGLGVSGTDEVGAYCGSGVNACSVVLALEQAGLRSPEDPAVLYPGSWSEWAGDPQREAAVGQEAG
ncbi:MULTISPECIES: sulfurtransferase [unclassified Actinopolyspora]|uniref:sulfurtransferase n=1 Tax=unclassified Actinopolyspora TaxID=2639451 RepID=UPI0013F63C1A|nr:MULTISPECIES: sulfurtransferase [unclassified Actinopolyspora]NHD17402.1 sulfurtransferase [Actinopolyspora sp. BKK2]NHE76865.1 sulfurtransferase [Actinopolyspora sp. BKK1]